MGDCGWMDAMSELSQMSGTGTAVRKAVVAKRKVASTDIIVMMPQTFADEPIVPIHLPRRLPFRPSIPAKEIRRAAFKVVRERQARERETALNGTNPE